MKTINISFFNFWNGFDISNNLFTKVLSNHYNITIYKQDDILRNAISQKDIDLIIYSCFGDRRILNNIYCKKLYWCGENDFPDLNFADYAITSTYLTYYDRHLRVPYWFFEALMKDKGDPSLVRNEYNSSLFNRKFCSFVVSNNNCSIPLRTTLYNEISKYNEISSGGRYMNNVGGPVKDKDDFIYQYKFNIASENSIVDGYVTEKILDAFYKRTIPIYLGTNNVKKEFNEKSFINVTDFPTFNELRKYIEEIDTNENLYKDMLTCDLYNGENMYDKYYKDFEDYMIHIIEEGKIYNKLYGRIGLKNKNNIIVA